MTDEDIYRNFYETLGNIHPDAGLTLREERIAGSKLKGWQELEAKREANIALARGLIGGRDDRATGDARYAGVDLGIDAGWASVEILSGGRKVESIEMKLRADAAAAERARILALLHDIRPLDEPYTRREWAIEQEGAKAMYEKIIAAISQPAKAQGEA